MIVVASVHHTGTNFVWQHLLKGMTQVGMNYDPSGRKRPPENGFVRIHCDTDQHGYLQWWLKQFPCIVPLRHPMAVAASWKAREKSLDNLAIQWKILKEKVDPYLPMYLPIDSPDREQWLEQIRGFLNPELQTDWPVIMSCNKSAELSDNDRQAVVEVMADGFFDRFGYEE
jgi:hypothetical protein